jgi:hypothetical protein
LGSGIRSAIWWRSVHFYRWFSLKDLERRHRSALRYAALARGDYQEIAYQLSPFNEKITSSIG